MGALVEATGNLYGSALMYKNFQDTLFLIFAIIFIVSIFGLIIYSEYSKENKTQNINGSSG